MLSISHFWISSIWLFMTLGDPFHGSIHTPEDLLQKSAWRYVNHCRSTHIVYGNKEGIPLHERIQRIENSKEYKAKFYCYNMANTPPAMIPSELGYSFCLFLNNTTFCDYFECLKSMSLTKITPTRNLYNRLEQSHSRLWARMPPSWNTMPVEILTGHILNRAFMHSSSILWHRYMPHCKKRFQQNQ